MDSDRSHFPPLPGFRLAKLEVFNWGTFDGAVYSAQPRGNTALLIGENGSGKSTLVDALLTLLVKPQTRNYNVAAGAIKNERDERTYVRGAFDRMVGEGGRPQIQYLRSGRGHYTVVLATFANEASNKAFTLAQVLYLAADNNVEKIYAFADSEKSTVEHLGDLSSSGALAKQIRERGFKTTSSYKEYFDWLRKATGFRSKAMDIFNQTVAVKDVQRLDLFIRQHMLERKDWQDRVSQLLKHFAELSESHRMLVQVRQQHQLLSPIVQEGHRYTKQLQESENLQRSIDALELYFCQEQIHLLSPLCETLSTQIEHLTSEIKRLDGLQDKLRRDIARLEIDIENAGGDRLRQLPGLIDQAEQIAKAKRENRIRFDAQLQLAGITIPLTSPDQFQKVKGEIVNQQRILTAKRDQVRLSANEVQHQIHDLNKNLQEDLAEAAALEKRKGNLPESFIAMRELMCRELKLAPSDLPFAAELIAVDPQHRDWESSIEQVLHSFARSLLVSTDHYSRVSAYVDKTRLTDARGVGQRLVYLKVSRTAADSDSKPKAHRKGAYLGDKLNYRSGHSLERWIQHEIESRFDYLACDTIEEFQRATGSAMTKNRHLKSGNNRHEKDDRKSPDDRRHFVLGWDNREKRLALAESIRQHQEELVRLQFLSRKQFDHVDQLTSALSALEQASSVTDFDVIDHERHLFEASQLRIEKQNLEESNDQVKELRRKVSELKAESLGYQQDRDSYIESRTTRESELRSGQQIVSNAQRRVDQAKQDGSYERAEYEFANLRQLIKQQLTIENIVQLPLNTAREQRAKLDLLRRDLQPISRELTALMSKFLKKFPNEQSDLDAHTDSLPSFVALFQRIDADDLPRHEERFKNRLNEKVLHEIGLLHGNLESDRQEIREKIEQLNIALKLLPWKAGTFMQLEPSDVQDREILDFRRELAGCLSGSFDSTPESNEATFTKIEKLVEKLRDESNSRWREKVVDVRNWFNFAARELVTETGETRSYYDGGTGQSGGEKGKLAFLVLVAAIAYQYDITPDAEQSDRFHFVMVDEMFSRSDDQHAEYALELFDRFRLQLLIVAPLDAKARVTEPYVGTYLHVVKNKQTNRSELLTITSDELRETIESL